MDTALDKVGDSGYKYLLFQVVRISAAWSKTYEYLLDTDYEKNTNKYAESKRKGTLLNGDVMFVMIALRLRGEISQAELGRMINKNDRTNGRDTGVKIRNWVENYLMPMGLIHLNERQEGKVKYNYFRLTNLGKWLMARYETDLYELFNTQK